MKLIIAFLFLLQSETTKESNTYAWIEFSDGSIAANVKVGWLEDEFLHVSVSGRHKVVPVTHDPY